MVEFTPLPALPLLTVWGGESQALAAAAGMALPPALCRATLAPGGAVLRLGPTEWLMMGDAARADAWAGLDTVDVSGAWTGWRIAGRGARALLARGAMIDLDARHFPPGHCARTRVARCPAILLPRAEDTIDLFAARSYAPWLLGWLHDAARVAGLA